METTTTQEPKQGPVNKVYSAVRSNPGKAALTIAAAAAIGKYANDKMSEEKSDKDDRPDLDALMSDVGDLSGDVKKLRKKLNKKIEKNSKRIDDLDVRVSALETADKSAPAETKEVKTSEEEVETESSRDELNEFAAKAGVFFDLAESLHECEVAPEKIVETLRNRETDNEEISAIVKEFKGERLTKMSAYLGTTGKNAGARRRAIEDALSN